MQLLNEAAEKTENGFNMILLDTHHCCSALCQLKVEGRREWTEFPLRVFHAIRKDGQVIARTEAIELSRTTNRSTATGRIDRSFFSVMNATLNFAEAFELQYGVSYAEDRIKDIVENMMPSQYIPKHSRSSCFRYVRFCSLMKKNSNLLPLSK